MDNKSGNKELKKVSFLVSWRKKMRRLQYKEIMIYSKSRICIQTVYSGIKCLLKPWPQHEDDDHNGGRPLL